MKITYLGHAAFKVETGGKIIYFDPWIRGNPVCPITLDDVKRADLVLVSHDHGDHGLEDGIEICRRTGATLVGIYEISEYALSKGVSAAGGNIGGTLEVKDVKVVITPALHSCSRGTPVGFIVDAGEGGIYHAGDTGLFSEMEIIGRLYKPRVCLLPIGSIYTMGPVEAAEAARMLNPELVIPMHYGTFPVLTGSAEEFMKEMEKRAPNVGVRILKPGETYG